jgi:hypothetical protein
VVPTRHGNEYCTGLNNHFSNFATGHARSVVFVVGYDFFHLWNPFHRILKGFDGGINSIGISKDLMSAGVLYLEYRISPITTKKFDE